MNLKEKPRKKVIHKRKFLSAPNLPVDELRVKTTDMFPISPAEIRKYKKEMNITIGENQSKKTKPVVKKTKNKFDVNDINKILLEANKQINEEKKNSDDYQWLIKKNIVKLMGEARLGVRNIKPVPKKSETKLINQSTKTGLEKTKSDFTKGIANQQTIKHKEPNTRIKTEGTNETKIKRKITRTKQELPLPPVDQKSNKKSNIQKLRNFFQVFKPQPETNKTVEPGRNELSLYEELKQAEEKEKQERKKIAKKKSPEKLSKKFKSQDDSSELKPEKSRPRKKKASVSKEIKTKKPAQK